MAICSFLLPCSSVFYVFQNLRCARQFLGVFQCSSWGCLNLKNVLDVPNSVSQHSHLGDCTAVKKLYLKILWCKTTDSQLCSACCSIHIYTVVYIFDSICYKSGFTATFPEPVSY